MIQRMGLLRLSPTVTDPQYYGGPIDFPMMPQIPGTPFILRDVQGLGPPESAVRYSRATQERGVYQGRSTSLRQIVITAAMQPDRYDYTLHAVSHGSPIEELRHQLYSLMSNAGDKPVRVDVLPDNAFWDPLALPFMSTEGHISRIEAPLFVKDPMVQVIIDCEYPYLEGPSTGKTIPGVVWDTGATKIAEIENEGNAPTPFKMGIVLQQNSSDPLIFSDMQPGGQSLTLTGLQWQVGDKVIINTIPGQRGVWRSRGGAAFSSIIGHLDGSADWLTLKAGYNAIGTIGMDFTIDEEVGVEYRPAYWGV